jgi:hypothetical protein
MQRNLEIMKKILLLLAIIKGQTKIVTKDESTLSPGN